MGSANRLCEDRCTDLRKLAHRLAKNGHQCQPIFDSVSVPQFLKVTCIIPDTIGSVPVDCERSIKGPQNREETYDLSSARRGSRQRLLCGVQGCRRDACSPASGCNPRLWSLQPTLSVCKHEMTGYERGNAPKEPFTKRLELYHWNSDCEKLRKASRMPSR